MPGNWRRVRTMGSSKTVDRSGEGDDISDEDQGVLLDLLFEHRADVIRQFLRDREMPVSGTKEQLRDRVTGYLTDGDVSAAQLIDLLDTVEGWGNQHAFLVRVPATSTALEAWQAETSAR